MEEIQHRRYHAARRQHQPVGAQHDHRHDASGAAPHGSSRLRRHGVLRRGRFKKVVREQLDNPWDWVRYGQKEIKNTRLRYHGGLTGGFILSPLCIPRLLLEAGRRTTAST